MKREANYTSCIPFSPGFESFLFVPNRTTSSGCNIRDAIDLKRTMIIVVMALIPALLFGIYNVGYQHFNAMGTLADTGFFELFFYGLWRVLPMIVVSYVVGLGIEFAGSTNQGTRDQRGIPRIRFINPNDYAD